MPNLDICVCPPLILVWYPWLCSQLVQFVPVISLLPCQMWNWPVFLVHILLRCPQGSAVGPVLFFMYTTPLSTTLAKIRSFSWPIFPNLYRSDFLIFWGGAVRTSHEPWEPCVQRDQLTRVICYKQFSQTFSSSYRHHIRLLVQKLTKRNFTIELK